MDADGRNTGNARLSTVAGVSLSGLCYDAMLSDSNVSSAAASPTSATSNTGAI